MYTSITVTAFYKFQPLKKEDLSVIREKLLSFGKGSNLKGLVLLAEEGINGTVAGPADVIEEWKELIGSITPGILYKDSLANEQPFKRWFVKIRDEIVNIENPNLHPAEGDEHHHLSPTKWNKMIEEEDVVVLDARNDYETEVGIFEGAVDPKLENFQEFPGYIRKSSIPKDKKVLMYCTGGIRCEKALLEMQRQGYTNVYQLKGGILKYMEEYPNEKFKGECFVFDHRVCVGQDLHPSKRYGLCPHCGDPGDQRIACERCGADGVICIRCQKNEYKRTCSRNCAYHYERMQKKSVVA